MMPTPRKSDAERTPSHSHSVPPGAREEQARRQREHAAETGQAGLAAAAAMGAARPGEPVLVLEGGTQVAALADAESPGEQVVVQTPHGMVIARRVGSWSDWLFGCFDDPANCLLALVLPPVRWAMTISRAGFMTFTRALLLMGLPWAVYFSCYVAAIVLRDSSERTASTLWTVAVCFSIFTLVVGFHFRQMLRRRYSIPRQELLDFLVWWILSWCATAQEARHVDRDTGHLNDGVHVTPVIVVEDVPVVRS